MSDCTFQLENGKWICTMCGWIYPLPSKEPPRKNCAKSPQGIAGRIINLEAEAKAQYNKHPPLLIRRDHYELTRIITICLDCDQHDGRCNGTRCYAGGCIPRFPDGCPGRTQWIKSLSSVGFRECPKWIQ